nr:heparinase II/III family protein [Candidatus Sigynarchaeota archaeon]
LEYKFELFGHAFQGDHLPWHEDFVNKHSWSPGIKSGACLAHSPPGADPKVPWELSRCHHLVRLGQAFCLTRDEVYATSFQSTVLDWMKNNKQGMGINWASTMDVAIRAINFLVALELFSEYTFPDTFYREFFTSIVEHALFIADHLEYYPEFTSNHLLSCFLGLLVIGLKCPFLPGHKTWIKDGLSGLMQEITRQVHADGTDFEASTCYHMLVLEMLLYANWFMRKCNLAVPALIPSTIQNMLRFASQGYLDHMNMPQVGDNDSGRIIKFKKAQHASDRFLVDWGILSSLGCHEAWIPEKPDAECYWLLGAAAHTSWPKRTMQQPEEIQMVFQDAGWSILRQGTTACLVSCGKNGQNGVGGHAHNDKLGFELVIDGERLVVDPGSCTYTG